MRFDDGIYPAFVRGRIRNITDHAGPGWFKGKTVLEVGCGYGYAGELLEGMGAIVTSLDARAEHIDVVKRRYPKRATAVKDLNKDSLKDLGRFDSVVAIGLLYHLENPAFCIKEIAAITPIVYLCSIVFDTVQPVCKATPGRTEFDQGTTRVSCLPSPAWIEKEFERWNFACRDISTDKANAPGNKFDWTAKNDGSDTRDGCYLRRMFHAYWLTEQERTA